MRDNPNIERVSDWVEMDDGLGRACIVILDLSNAKLDDLIKNEIIEDE